MSYTLLDPQPPQRSAEWLAREPDASGEAPYDQVAPGLYPDEIAVLLDTGESAAVSVEREWKENGAGINLTGYARWIDDDGSSLLSADRKQVETSYQAGFDNGLVAAHGVEALMTEVARVLLEEPPLLLMDDGGGTDVPVHNPSEAAKNNGSVKKAIATVKQMAAAQLRL